MDIELLKEFLILARCLNFSKAADSLYMSQPVLSRHIQNLENHLGVALFARDKHSVTLTDIGKIFAHDVERIVEDYELSMKHIQMSKTGAVGAIELTTSYTLSSLFIYDFFPAFNRDYPDIKVNFIIEESGPFIKKRIEENKTDLVLMLDWTERIFPNLEHITLVRDHFYVFANDDHPIAHQKEVTIKELSGIPMVYLDIKEQLCSVNFFQQLFLRHHSIYNPAITATSTEGLFLEVLTGKGISILSEPVFRYTPSKIHVTRISDPDAYINTNLIWCRHTTNPCVPIFVEAFSKFAQDYYSAHSTT